VCTLTSVLMALPIQSWKFFLVVCRYLEMTRVKLKVKLCTVVIMTKVYPYVVQYPVFASATLHSLEYLF